MVPVWYISVYIYIFILILILVRSECLLIYIHTYIHTYIQTYRHTDIQTYRHTDIQTYRHTDIQTYRHTDIQTYRHTDIQTYRHTDIHTYIHTDTHTYIHTSIHPSIHPYIHTYLWRFPKMGVPANHPFFSGFSIVNHPFGKHGSLALLGAWGTCVSSCCPLQPQIWPRLLAHQGCLENMGTMSCPKKLKKNDANQSLPSSWYKFLIQDDTTPKFHLFWSLWTSPHWIIRIIPARLNRCRSQRSDSCAWACLSCRWHLWRSAATWNWRCAACAAGGLWFCWSWPRYGYGSIPIDTFLVGWTSIYQLFWGSLGTRVLTHPHMAWWVEFLVCEVGRSRMIFLDGMSFCFWEEHLLGKILNHV